MDKKQKMTGMGDRMPREAMDMDLSEESETDTAEETKTGSGKAKKAGKVKKKKEKKQSRHGPQTEPTRKQK